MRRRRIPYRDKLSLKIIPFCFVCHEYTQNVTKKSPILLQNMKMFDRQIFLLFKKSTTFWDNPRIFRSLYIVLNVRDGIESEYPSMADSSQFSPLTTLSEQLGPNSWVSSVFIPAFIANIGTLFFLKYDYQNSKSIQNILFYNLFDIFTQLMLISIP